MKRAYCSFKPHSIVFAAVKYFWEFTAVGEIPWSLSLSFLPIRKLKALRFGLQKWHFSVTRLKCGAVSREHPDRFGTPKKWFSGAKLHSLGNAARHTRSLSLCQNPKYRFKKRTRNVAQDSGLWMHFKQEPSLMFNVLIALSGIRIRYKRRSTFKQIT